MLLKSKIQKSLEAISDQVMAQKITKYMKNVSEYRGIQQPGINSVFKQYWQSEMKGMSKEDLFELGGSLIQERYGEDKCLGLQILKKIEFDLQRIKHSEQWFREGFLKGWAETDVFCYHVLKGWVGRSNENAKYMLQWAASENLWMRRASCVGFVCLARKADEELLSILYEICSINIKHSERFNQLGTGWLLREMYLKDGEGVLRWIDGNLEHFSAEGLRYAYEKMNKELQSDLKTKLKQRQRQDQGDFQDESVQKQKHNNKRRI